jgi:hypothetical protein
MRVEMVERLSSRQVGSLVVMARQGVHQITLIISVLVPSQGVGIVMVMRVIVGMLVRMVMPHQPTAHDVEPTA